MTTQQYEVTVKSHDGWTLHSQHSSYREAVDQADMVHGRVMLATGMTDVAAWRYAVVHQGFDGNYAAWSAQNDDERAAYEIGANPVG
jgi:precorrin-6x reductase